MTQPTQAILVDARDHVATAFVALAAGTVLKLHASGVHREVQLREPIDVGHKFAVVDLPAGAPVLKYASAIGRTLKPVRAGEHVHLHNLESQRGRGDLS